MNSPAPHKEEIDACRATSVASNKGTLLSSGRIRVKLLKTDPEKDLLHCVTVDASHHEIIVKQEITREKNGPTQWIEIFREGVQLNLIDCDVDKNGQYIPKLIVLEPDYLSTHQQSQNAFRIMKSAAAKVFRNRTRGERNRFLSATG